MTRNEGRPGPAPLPLPAGWPIMEHCHWLFEVRRNKPGTVRDRRLKLARFGRSHPDPWTVDRDDVGLYLLQAAPEYANGLRAALHGFYAWAAAERIPGGGLDPTLGIRVEVNRGVPHPCPDRVWLDAEARLLASTDPRDQETGRMIALGARCGLRRAEIAGVHTRDLQGANLTVVGKGDKPRLVMAGPRIRRMILQAPPGWLFPGAKPGQHITADAAGRRISAALPPGWTAHTLRHRYATTLYGYKHDLIAVQRQLGHSSPVTTQIYIGVDDALDPELEAILDRT